VAAMTSMPWMRELSAHRTAPNPVATVAHPYDGPWRGVGETVHRPGPSVSDALERHGPDPLASERRSSVGGRRLRDREHPVAT